MRAFGIIIIISILISSCQSGSENEPVPGSKVTTTSSVMTQTTVPKQDYREFVSSFESVSDFEGFYIVPQGSYDSNHELNSEIVYDGKYSHKAWILKARDINNDGKIYLPHRAYPTIQFQNTPKGSFKTPCLISLYVYLDISLIDKPQGSIDDWFSFATLSPETDDNWARTVGVNLTPDGYVKLVHVPRQGEQDRIYQMSSSIDIDSKFLFAYKKWVRLDIFIDFDSSSGYAKVWQDGVLVSHAKVEGGLGYLFQSHFGMYSSASISQGIIYNDKLRIREVGSESDALTLVNSSY